MSGGDRRGLALALAAYVWWGLSPVYWRQLDEVPALDTLAHRIVWTVALLGVGHTIARTWAPVRTAAADRRNRWAALAAGMLIAVNWGVFIWAVGQERVVEASLGYFVNPLVSVLLGVLVLGERLRRGQWCALAIAAAGVVFLTVEAGRLPWIAAVLALTFGFYGLVRKQANMGSLDGLTLETGVVFLPALGFLAVSAASGEGTMGASEPGIAVLLVLSGVVTAAPLLAFASAARRVPLSTVGFLFYVNPTLQFLVGAVLYGEDVPPARLAGYAVVWSALAVFALEGARHLRRGGAQRVMPQRSSP
jgi:chloramphenicol-sensitive protein RarD